MPAWIIGAGMLVGGVANAYSENQKNKAHNQGLSNYASEVGAGQEALMAQLYGPQGLSDFNLMMGSGYQNAPVAPPQPQLEQFRQSDGSGYDQWSYQRAMAGWKVQNDQYEKDLAAWRAQAQQTQAGATARWNQLTGGPIIQQLHNIRDIGVQGGTGIARDADRRYAAQNALSSQMGNRLSTLYSSAEQPFQQFGREREAGIREDAAIGLKNANQMAKASMAGLGANTLVGNQLSSNAMESQRQMQRSLTDVGERRAQLVGGVRTQKAGAMGQWMAGDMNRRSANDQSRLTLASQGLERRLSLESLVPNMLYQTQQSPTMNPYLNLNPQQLAPGAYSPIGAFGQTLGAGISGYGGYQMGMQGMGGGAVNPGLTSQPYYLPPNSRLA